MSDTTFTVLVSLATLAGFVLFFGGLVLGGLFWVNAILGAGA